MRSFMQFNRGTYQFLGNYDYDLIRLVKGQHLGVDVNFFNPEYVPPWYATPFLGVEFAHPQQVMSKGIYSKVMLTPIKKPPMRNLVAAIRSALKSYFNKVIRKGNYIVFHSAGFDSRIISLVLMELRDEGHDMSGVHFRCYQPEGPMFLKIMEQQGWDKSQYSVFKGEKADHYDIGRSDRPLNGWQNYNQQMNFWSDIIENEKEWNVITGVGGELFKFLAKPNPKYDPQRTLNKNLNLLLNQYPDEGQWEGYYRRVFKEVYLPFFSYQYLGVSLLNSPDVSWDGQRDSVRGEVVRSFIDSHGVDCFYIKYGEHDYSWNISELRKEYIEGWFYQSQLYRDYKEYIPKGLDFTSNLYGYEAKLWGFATVYENVY